MKYFIVAILVTISISSVYSTEVKDCPGGGAQCPASTTCCEIIIGLYGEFIFYTNKWRLKAFFIISN